MTGGTQATAANRLPIEAQANYLTPIKNLATVSAMDATADLFEIEEHPRAGVIREIRHAMAALQRMKAKHGEMFTQAQIATVTGLTRQRISELLTLGTFSRHELRSLEGEVLGIFVPAAEVLEWIKSNPRPGRKVSPLKFVASATDIS